MDAFNRLGEQLSTLAKEAESCFDRDSADLFRAHRMICEEVRNDVLELINQGQLNAVSAIETCFDYYSDFFDGLNDDYFCGRADDFTELKQLLLNLLNNKKVFLQCREYRGCNVGECELKNKHILICNELTANVAFSIRYYTRGIITDRCGVNSHAAVIARSLDIPIISGIKNPLKVFLYDNEILMDGGTGDIFTNPDSSTLERYYTRINRAHKTYEAVDPLPQFAVMADIDRCQDVERALRVRADGIGMYRTEFEMLARGHVLSEEEQTEIYNQVLQKMQGKPVYFRLFDLGCDKSAPWLEIEEENNPALGCRGARFLLSRPELLETQARAVANVSRSAPVNVIYPMISGRNEYQQLKKIFMQATRGIKNTQIRHGIMFEVPSACLNASDLYDVIEFGRIGSNDLIQYLFARDRTGDGFIYADLAGDPAVWNLIATVAGAARKAGKPLELCGSIADTGRFIHQMMKLGIKSISTHPENIAAIRKTVVSELDPVSKQQPVPVHMS